MSVRTSLRHSAWWLGLFVVSSLPLAAQAPPAVPVGVTAAQSASVRSSVELPGTVEARTSAVVASEVAGLVVELTAREGDSVRRGAPVARLRIDNLERDLDAARARLAESAARSELAESSLVRTRELFDSGVVSRQDLDDAVSEAGAWQGRISSVEAEIARLETLISRSVVRAPFSGVVVAKHCELGEWVEVGGSVVEMVDPARLEVVVSVPQHHFAGAKKGSTAQVRFESLPEVEMDGKIVAVIPRADEGARTFPVRVAIDNRERRIGVGMSATVALATGAEHLAVVVPKDALLTQGRDRFVYRVETGPDGGEVARRVAVRLGSGVGEWIEVDGLAVGDRVVTRGNERLAPDSAVTASNVEYANP